MPWRLQLVACLLKYAACSDSHARRLTDSDVIDSQQVSMLAWKNHLNKGDFDYAGQAYSEDASLYATLGPTSVFMKLRFHFDDPMVLRGRKAIKDFWEDMTSKVGLHGFRVFEDKGLFRSMTLVVNDDEVTVSGFYKFNAFAGRVLSQTWVRVSGDSWKIKSHMFSIDESDTKALEAKQNRTVDADVDIVQKVDDMILPSKELDKFKNGHELKQLPPAKTGSSYVIWMLVIVFGSVGAFACIKVRGQGRSYRNIGGVDSMLG